VILQLFLPGGVDYPAGARCPSPRGAGDNFPRVVPTLLTLWSTRTEGTSHEHIREPSRRKRWCPWLACNCYRRMTPFTTWWSLSAAVRAASIHSTVRNQPVPD